MGGFKAGRWSGASHAWWTGGKPGDRLVLEVPVDVSGPYEIFAICTKAPDYGRVTMAWNGASASAPVDLYDAQVIPMPPVSLGVHEVRPGKATLAIEIVGANPAATPAYMFGLDCLVLIPRQSGMPSDAPR